MYVVTPLLGKPRPKCLRSVADWQRFVALNLRNWERLNLDWLRNFPGPTHVITYQQLVNDTEHALQGVLRFLGVAVPTRQLQCALERKEGIYRWGIHQP